MTGIIPVVEQDFPSASVNQSIGTADLEQIL